MNTRSLDINTALPLVPSISHLPQWYAKRDSLYPIKKDLNTFFLLYSSSGKRLDTRQLHLDSLPKAAHGGLPKAKCHKTELSILYLHGFSSSPRETSPLIEQISSKLKANTVAIRLPQHGLSHSALSYLDYRDLYASALEGVAVARKLGKKLIVISCSTGSTLGILLSMRRTAHKEMDMHVCLSPNLGIQCKKLLFSLSFHRLQQRVIYFLSYLHRNSSKRRYSRKKNEAHEAYNTLDAPLSSYYHMLALVYRAWKLRRSNPRSLRVATFIYARKDDAVVRFARTKKFFAGAGAGAQSAGAGAGVGVQSANTQSAGAQSANTQSANTSTFVELPTADYSHTHVIAGTASSPSSTRAMAASIGKTIQDFQKEFHS